VTSAAQLRWDPSADTPLVYVRGLSLSRLRSVNQPAFPSERQGSHVGAMVFAGIVGVVVLVASMTVLRGPETLPRSQPNSTPRASVVPTIAPGPLPKLDEIDSAWVSQGPPQTIGVGGEATYTFSFRNTGKAAWQRGGTSEVGLGFTGDDSRFDPRMAVEWPSSTKAAVQTEAVVAPGQTATFTFKVRGVAPGKFRIDLRPVMSAVGWLRDEGVYTEVVVR
jgi:hypothetical protein